MLITTKTLPAPKNQKAEILYDLITSNEITESNYPYTGFRSRLSDLRRLGLTIRFQWKNFKSRYGRKGRFKVHYLWETHKRKAVRLYREINK